MLIPCFFFFFFFFAGHINHTLFWENLAPTSSGGGEVKDGGFQ
jgi:superoxide dismutase